MKVSVEVTGCLPKFDVVGLTMKSCHVYVRERLFVSFLRKLRKCTNMDPSLLFYQRMIATSIGLLYIDYSATAVI